MFQIHFSKEGLANYMVVDCKEPWDTGYQSNLFQYHRVPYFLPFEIREVDGLFSVYYRLHYRTTVRSVEGHLPFTLNRLKNMVKSIIGVLETAEEYLLEPEGILWRTDSIFLEADTGNLQFCYCLADEENKGSMKEFLTEIIQMVNKAEEAAVLFILQFYDLVTEPSCTLETLQEFQKKWLEENKNRKEEVEEGEKEADETRNEKHSGKDGFLFHSVSDDTKERKTGEQIVKGMLVLTAGSNIVLIMGLLLNLLTYDYMRFLFFTMGALILLTVIYMQITKEESADEIMKEYFENQELKEEPKLQETAGREQPPVWGETGILIDSLPDREKIIKEEKKGCLYLEPMEKERYQPIHIKEKSIVLGSMAEGCDYRLQENGVSRLHAKIMDKGDGIYLLDLNSTNGTYLNGEMIKCGQDYKLEEGDMVVFAKSEFYVAMEASGYS